MDMNSIADSVTSQTASQRTGDAVGITVARTAMDLQAKQADQLISSIPKSEPNLGNSINTSA